MERKLDGHKRISEHGELFIWMQLLGLDRDLPDYGITEWKERMGFTPDGVCLFLPHSDVINEHTDMEKEFELHPDDCSYCAIPRNAIRERQPWTNYDLRGAAKELKKAGIAPYLSIQGAEYKNAFHREWITDHPEIHAFFTDGSRRSMYVLKRFTDGTYYEDFFIDKLCKTLVDYGFDGIQLADQFCPPGGVTHNCDFSTDMMEQFFTHTGITPPQNIIDSMGNDDGDMIKMRGEWVWKNVRADWLLFLTWRWEGFCKKLCDAVHAIGKKVITLAVYLTDPLETIYSFGVDIKRFAKAGVDYIMPNTLPTSVYFNGREESFWRYMATIPLNSAFLEGTEQLCMLGVKDSTEEWDAIQHAPCEFQRDLYTILGQQEVKDDEFKRAADGIMICLGDAIEQREWQEMRKHFDVAYHHDIESIITPVVLWSDAEMYNSLPEIIKSGRWSTYKFVYETANHGTPCGASVRIENINSAKSTIFVPNFDLLPENEKKIVAAYSNGPVVATIPADYEVGAYGIKPVISFTDKTAKFPMTVIAFGAEATDELRAQIEACLATPDVEPEPPFSIDEIPTWAYTLDDSVPYIKHATGFLNALAYLLYHINDANIPFTTSCKIVSEYGTMCSYPNVVYKLKNGKYRVFLYNPDRNRYRKANIISDKGITDAKVVSHFPQLPVKYNNQGKSYVHNYEDGDNKVYNDFTTKVMPAGVTIVDVTIAE